MDVSRPLRVLQHVVNVGRPSMRLIVASGLTNRITSMGVVASGLGCNVNTLLLLRMANREIAVVFVGGVDIAILGVDIAILGVDIATTRSWVET